jgi:hypothetical protein
LEGYNKESPLGDTQQHFKIPWGFLQLRSIFSPIFGNYLYGSDDDWWLDNRTTWKDWNILRNSSEDWIVGIKCNIGKIFITFLWYWCLRGWELVNMYVHVRCENVAVSSLDWCNLDDDVISRSYCDNITKIIVI